MCVRDVLTAARVRRRFRLCHAEIHPTGLSLAKALSELESVRSHCICGRTCSLGEIKLESGRAGGGILKCAHMSPEFACDSNYRFKQRVRSDDANRQGVGTKSRAQVPVSQFSNSVFVSRVRRNVKAKCESGRHRHPSFRLRVNQDLGVTRLSVIEDGYCVE
jgi:hypothetical protein